MCVELARLVHGTVDCFLDSCGLPLGGRGLRFVGVAADQPLLSGCGLSGPIRGMHQNHLSLLLSCVELAPLVSDTVDRMLECGSRLEGCIRMSLSLLLYVLSWQVLSAAR